MRFESENSAETWGEGHIEDDTALELAESLRRQGYEVRLVVEALHPESSVIKAVDSQESAEETLQNIEEATEEGVK